MRRYDVAAISVDITLNRYLDHDPEGRMYVLEADLERVRAEEAANALARSAGSEPSVSAGLQGDAIQPLILRVNQGECLTVALRNALGNGEAASFHLHGGALRVAGSAQAATDTATMVAPGRTAVFEWMVAGQEQEGTYYFHSETAAVRDQTSHGLFGAVVVERAGATWLDPRTGAPLRSGWDAVIVDPDGSDFRELALVYHEIGDENYQFLDRSGHLVPLVDPLTSAYRPGSRALNYRSEPFLNRLALQQQRTGSFDESVAYSSYSFGDPATPIARTYLGDPVKQRLVHGGSEVAHVHHQHGGAVRWRRQPGVEPTGFDQGLVKRPPLRPEASERIDSQTISPSETFDVENECGSGGCQQSAGDFLFHCHVAQHYFSGMWGINRVYNTLQDGQHSTDDLPPLVELPDRQRTVQAAVTPDTLIGATVDWDGMPGPVTAEGLAAWMGRQLPPPGVPRGYDASVLDWVRDGARYLGEPEAPEPWPGYRPRAPNTRPALTVDPRTGRLAYPFLRPHLGKRPPFAPNHGPAPFLDPVSPGTDVPGPGENGPGSVCPSGTRPKALALQAISVPVALNQKAKLVDSAGALFVLKNEEAQVRADDRLKVPLTVRANAAEDCIDVLLRSELSLNSTANAMSKVSAHIHLMQFDIQASDGINTGFGYEQTVRPFTEEAEVVSAGAPAGATTLTLGGTDRYQPGVLVGVGMDEDETFEVRRIAEVRGPTLVFDEPLRFAHAVGEVVSTEFARYRWYPDVQSGTAYFHDHVNALSSWRHGLYGAVVVEPPGSTYHDPRTGAEIDSGPIADIRTDAPVSADVTGSFREMVCFLQDDSPITGIGRSPGSALNLRAEPLADRREDDPSRAFSSEDHGDPETPILEANLGDPLVFRTLVGGTNEVHTWHLDGHWFRAEPWSRTSPPVDTVHVGISERYDLVVPRAGGPQQMPGDYLYYNGRSFKLREGSWGILRVRDGAGNGLQPLPDRPAVPRARSICPPLARSRRFEVAAIDAALPMLEDEPGKLFVLQADKAAVRAGTKAPEPMVLRANVGDCITVELTNDTEQGPVSFHAGMLSFDPRGSGGVTAGFNPGQAVYPGQSRTSTFFASPEVGETTALVRDFGDVVVNPRLGLYAAIVVGPQGAEYRDPATGEDASGTSSWKVDVVPPSGPAYRDVTLFLQDEDESIGTHRMPYTSAVRGVTGLNYRIGPFAEDPLPAGASAASAAPVVEAFAGDPVKIHVLAPWSEQAQVFSIEGHRWPFEPGREGSDLQSAVTIGGMEAITVHLDGGAGGPEGLTGDFLFGDHRLPFREAGMWGILRVWAPAAHEVGSLNPLPTECGAGGACDPRRSSSNLGVVLAGLAVALLGGATGLGATKRRRNRRSVEQLARR